MSERNNMKCVFSLDDYCYENRDVVKYIHELNDYFDNFKISLFTIPCYKGVSLDKNLEWFWENHINSEYILHGFWHMNYEFLHLNEEQCSLFVDLGIKVFQKCNIRFVPGFKAPNWRYNKGLVKALKKKDFWMAVYSERHIVLDVPCYVWNWDIGETKISDWLLDVPIIHAHGHCLRQSGPGKYLKDYMDNIKKLPKNTEFYFISEFMNGKV